MVAGRGGRRRRSGEAMEGGAAWTEGGGAGERCDGGAAREAEEASREAEAQGSAARTREVGSAGPRENGGVGSGFPPAGGLLNAEEFWTGSDFHVGCEPRENTGKRLGRCAPKQS